MGDPQSPAPSRSAFSEALALLRAGRFASAERQLRAIQASAPGDVVSSRLLGAALLAQDKVLPALEILERTVAAAPRFWPARTELARALRAAGRLEDARSHLRQVVEADPALDGAWLAYGDVLVDLGRYPDARFAYERARLADPFRRRIEEATGALTAEDRKTAEIIFRDILKIDASHVGALCGLAAVSLTVSRGRDAERLLRHALKQSAHLPLAWRGLCQAMVDLGRLPEAEAAVRHLLKMEPENPANWVLLGNVCARLMRQPDALTAYEEAARLNPAEARLPLSIGHLYKTLGNRPKSEASYKASLQIDPAFGEAYWSLADLKNYVFDPREIASMQALLKGEDGEHNDQAQLHFALGRAFEHRREYVLAFEHYAQGNARRRHTAPFDMALFENKTHRVRECFDARFFAQRQGLGHEDPAPIFIVGLPRSGSTLVEQILASHSSVEGTFELPNVLTLVREFDHANVARDAYPENLREVPAAHFAGLGRRYIEETAPIRTGRARFIDKMPNNFSHVGLIHAILPKATIIDVRRHPMDSCFSTFKQYFAEGQSFSYDLEDLGRYYRCYLRLMDHWDEVLPGKVLHLAYEELVHDPETYIRRLLKHCGLDFEPACLAFHETKRPVRTASAEQVRQPLYTSGVGYWKHFGRELEPLRQALGDCLRRFE
ncbi:MAG TPA: sulfotransferase [Steroidobacteraceae bacterium]|jgi:tetratricopeptide (TPR) repeat protein|nr:sulfotransferase [Steroidobacteraceae bacterium]